MAFPSNKNNVISKRVWISTNTKRSQGYPCYIVEEHLARYFLLHDLKTVRSSHPEVFNLKSVFKNFAKFTGKHLRPSLFFNKVASRTSFL